MEIIMLAKTVLRTIRKSLGRYLAVLSIIALGVGFFAGLRVTKESMVSTLDGYLGELEFYDLKLMSTLGLTEDDVKAFSELDGVKTAAGSVSADFIYVAGDGSDAVLHAHTVLDGMNKLDIVSGKYPEKADECVVDSKLSGAVKIGDKIEFSKSNSEETRDTFAYDAYTVTGFVDSPEYIYFERGTTSLAGGTASGYIYILPDGFSADYYTEIYLLFSDREKIYSGEYEELTGNMSAKAEELLDERAEIRYNGIVSDAQKEIDDGQAELDSKKQELEDARKELEDGRAEYEDEKENAYKQLEDSKSQLDSAKAELEKSRQELEAAKSQPAAQLPEVAAQLAAAEEALKAGEQEYDENLKAYEKAAAEAEEKFESAEKELDDAQKEIDDALPEIEDAQKEIDDARAELADIKPATVYVLDRTSNVGYASFENDTDIVSGVSKVFPLFFFLVAALVCITTMTRMVSEQRTENGVLKALGFGSGAIAGQYLFYAGSASVIGCTAGFFAGSRLFPMILWEIYHVMYSVQRPVDFVLDWWLFAVCLLLYLVCMMGVAWLVCWKDMRESAAQLIRPKSPEAGKRILLERIGFIWKRLKFLHKVSVRNIMRYKKRMVMMIIGIGGCTALLIAGFGIRDTIRPIVDYQYNEITVYDASVTFLDSLDEAGEEKFLETGKEVSEDTVFLYSDNVKADTSDGEQSLTLAAFSREPEGFIDLHRGNSRVEFPGKGKAVINYRFAKEYGIKEGSSITLKGSDGTEFTVEISGIFDNYIFNYVFMSEETYESLTGAKALPNTAYVNFKEDQDGHAASATLLEDDDVANVSVSADMISRITGMLDALNYIVLTVLVCAGALAFIVLYNLTNITIIERSREIATLKVLGFYVNEQNSYVFRENIILTGISALCGIPMGMALLSYVMSQIKMNSFYFGCRLNWQSYLLAVVITFVFTLIVDAALTAKIKRVNMADAMKAIE